MGVCTPDGLIFQGSNVTSISRDELAALAKLGTRHGSLGTHEGVLLENILQLRQTRTAEILTPRTVVSALDVTLTVNEAMAQLKEVPFSRLPVFDTNLDAVVGLVLRPQILEAVLDDGGDDPLTDYLAPIYRVSAEATGADASRRVYSAS